MKIFVAQFILVEETLEGLECSLKSTEHYLSSSLFMAPDAERAFQTAQAWIAGHSDSTHDEIGNLLRYYSSGLFELEEVSPDADEFLSASMQMYGVDVGHLKVSELRGTPKPKSKEQLAVFARISAQPFNPADA